MTFFQSLPQHSGEESASIWMFHLAVHVSLYCTIIQKKTFQIELRLREQRSWDLRVSRPSNLWPVRGPRPWNREQDPPIVGFSCLKVSALGHLHSFLLYTCERCQTSLRDSACSFEGERPRVNKTSGSTTVWSTHCWSKLNNQTVTHMSDRETLFGWTLLADIRGTEGQRSPLKMSCWELMQWICSSIQQL